MKQKIYKMPLKELPMILHKNGTISRRILDRINRYCINNDKISFNAEFMRINMDLSASIFETETELDDIELQYVVADPEEPISKVEKFNSIW